MYPPPPSSTSSFCYTLATLNAFLRPTTTLGSGKLTWDISPTDYIHLDQWRVSRLNVISPTSVLRSRYVAARLFRGTESVNLRLELEPPQDSLPQFFDAVATALDALSTSTEFQETSTDTSGSSPTPPTTPSGYPLTITFSPIPNSQVTANVEAEEEILYQIPTTADEGSLTLLTLVHCITSIPLAGCRGDFAQDFINAFRRHDYLSERYNFVNSDLSDNESGTDTEECDEDDFFDYYAQPPRHLDLGLIIQQPELVGWIDISEEDELSNINEEFQRLREVRLQLAADLRSSLWDADRTAMEVQAFNTRQHEQLSDGVQFFIDFQEDLKTKQDVVDMIHRLEQSS